MIQTRFEFYYKQILAYQIACKLPLSNTMEIPMVDKIVVNVGFPHIARDKKIILSAFYILEKLTRQKAYPTSSKKQVAALKITKQAFVGAATTLRNKKMMAFLNNVVTHVFQYEHVQSVLSYEIIPEDHTLTFKLEDPTCFPTFDEISQFFPSFRELNFTIVFHAKETFWEFAPFMVFLLDSLSLPLLPEEPKKESEKLNE